MYMLYYSICFTVLLLCRSTWGFTRLSAEDLAKVPSPGDDLNPFTGKLLRPLLIPRASGTPGVEVAREHILTFFRKTLPNWQIEQHTFYQRVVNFTGSPFKNNNVSFTNIIATLDPPWAKPGDTPRLSLAAHYESKLTPPGFIGATDSAASCAILMHVARSVNDILVHHWDAVAKNATHVVPRGLYSGLQIIFFDGEEAFHEWTKDDSLYGSRQLAQAWESQPLPFGAMFRNPIESISMLILLDLLGAPQPQILSYFVPSHWAYKELAEIEQLARKRNLLLSDRPWSGTWFINGLRSSISAGTEGIQDDHLPFVERAVNVLHLIPSPFPSVWHTLGDNAENLDPPTINDWAKLMTAFTAQWFDVKW